MDYLDNLNKLSTIFSTGENVKISSVINKYEIKPEPEISKTLNPNSHSINAICASLQYCFWYGNSSYRPFNSSQLTTLVNDVLGNVNLEHLHLYQYELARAINNSGITMVPERKQSIKEVFKLDFVQYNKLSSNPGASLDYLMQVDTFRKDPFMKKAILAISSTYAERGNLSELLLPAPCDYRVPQALEALGLIKYSKSLQNKIKNHELILEGSSIELEIRSATYLACKILARVNNISQNQVDQYLFKIGKQLTSAHHLTYTTNY